MINYKRFILFIILFQSSCLTFTDDIDVHLKRLKSSNNIERLNAAIKLSQMGSKNDKKLISNLQKGEDIKNIHIIWILGEWREKSYISHIIPYLNSSHNVVRTSLVALGKIGDPSVIPNIVKKLNNPSRYIRTDAARALGRIGDLKGVPYLIGVKNDHDWHIREAVAKSLTEIGGELAVKHLKLIAENDSDGVVRAWADDGLIIHGVISAENEHP